MARTKSFTKSISKSLSKTGSGKGFLRNKTVLYIVTFIALMNLLGYVSLNNFNAVVMFLAVGIIAFQFTKNMIIVLLACLLATNIYAVSFQSKVKEGMKVKSKSKTSKQATSDAKEAVEAMTGKKVKGK